jgi:hypothetical protein
MSPEIVKERAIKVQSGCTGKSVERLRAMAERELHVLAGRGGRLAARHQL